MKTFNTLIFKQEESVAILSINRPQALNALNSQVFDELNEALDYIEQANYLKVLIITGEGKAFVAGADIAEMKNKNTHEAADFSERGQQTFLRLENLKIPVIAALNGFALGGGLELALAADFRFASEKAKMGQPEVNLGLIPGFAGTQRLSRLIGLADALYLLTTTETIDANEALRLKLVQKVFPHEVLMTETLKIAQLLAQKAPNALQKVKFTTRKGYEMPFAQAQKLESEVFGSCFDAEGKEGMNAFLEKRKPKF